MLYFIIGSNYPRSMHLYFFPAFLPIASLIPGILAVVGLLASAVGALRRRPRAALCLCLLSLIAAGAGILLSRKNARLRTQLPVLETPEKLPAVPTNGAWSQNLPRAPLSNLAYSVKHELLIFGTRQRTLDAISTKTGQIAFTLRFSEPILSEPLLNDDYLYVGEGLHEAKRSRLVAVRLPKGEPIWQREFPSHVESPPRLSKDGDILFGCAGDAGAYAVVANNGALLWLRRIGHCDSTPLIEGDTMYALSEFSSHHSQLVAMSTTDGELKWKIDLPGQPWGTIARDPRTNYLITTSGSGDLAPRANGNEMGWIHAVDSTKRILEWTQSLYGMPLLTGILLAERDRSLTIHALKKGEIVALDTKTGATQWTLRLSSPILSPLRRLAETNQLAAFALDGALHEIDGATGRTLSSRRLGGLSTSGAVFGAGKSFFADRATLWSFPTHDGKLLQ